MVHVCLAPGIANKTWSWGFCMFTPVRRALSTGCYFSLTPVTFGTNKSQIPLTQIISVVPVWPPGLTLNNLDSKTPLASQKADKMKNIKQNKHSMISQRGPIEDCNTDQWNGLIAGSKFEGYRKWSTNQITPIIAVKFRVQSHFPKWQRPCVLTGKWCLWRVQAMVKTYFYLSKYVTPGLFVYLCNRHICTHQNQTVSLYADRFSWTLAKVHLTWRWPVPDSQGRSDARDNGRAPASVKMQNEIIAVSKCVESFAF